MFDYLATELLVRMISRERRREILAVAAATDARDQSKAADSEREATGEFYKPPAKRSIRLLGRGGESC
jgi:hypothetical protein